MTLDGGYSAGVNPFQFVRDGDDAGLLGLLATDRAVADARGPDGASLVLFALYNGRSELAETLADARADLDVFEAAALGRTARLADLLRDGRALAGALSPDGFTALHLAAFFGRTEAARLLLDRGAEVGAVARNPMAVQPLHSAAAGRHAAVVALLLEAGVDANARQHGGWTPLLAAAAHADVTTIELLLAAGADPSLPNDAGQRPADLARERGHTELAARLAA